MNERTRELLEELLHIVQRYADVLPNAQEEGREYAAKSDWRHLKMALSALEQLIPEMSTNRQTEPARGEPGDVLARELTEILDDRDFLRTRQDLVAFVERHLVAVVAPFNKKDSRARIVRRTVRAFLALPPQAKQVAFARVQRSYLAHRRSSLADWSELITNGGARNK